LVISSRSIDRREKEDTSIPGSPPPPDIAETYVEVLVFRINVNPRVEFDDRG
jgi:hypothetical protein